MDRCRITPEKKPEESKTLLNHYDMVFSAAHELLVWEKWAAIRKEETRKIGSIVRRPTTDLVMNLQKRQREKLERKTTLDHAQIDKKATCRYSYFEQPQRLKTRCEYDNVYEVVRTRAEIGRPRIIEYVGVPRHIQETELAIAGTPMRQEFPLLNKGYREYRQKREKDLEKRLKKIDPFRPSTSQLIIQGFTPKPPPPKPPRLPKIAIEAPNSPPKEFIEGVYAVRINKSVWYKVIPGQVLEHLATYEKLPWHEDCSSWIYYFNVPVKRVGRGKLFLQNLGTVTLRYYWKKLRKELPLIPYDTDQVFYFNKNENILPPGQTREICITFVSNTPGIFHEYWELIFVNVCFFETINEKILIDLCGDAIEDTDTMKYKVILLQFDIHKSNLINMANEIIDEAFDKVFLIVPTPSPYKTYFLDAEIFVMKNPVCFYHQTGVTKLGEIYEHELAHGQTWDLSIATWRKAILTKNFDDRMRLYHSLQTFHADLLKPWYEGATLIKEKYRAINLLWKQLANKMDKDYDRLTLLVEKDRSDESKPNHIPNHKQWLRNLFYLYTYEHVACTIEQCAGVLSSLDSYRWIKFDFCRT